MGALNWNPEITAHNQKLFMQEQARASSGKAVAKKQANGELKLFPLVSASSMTDKMIQIIWLVKNFLEQGSLNLLFGEPGAGKSLLALDWAFCIATPLKWCGLHTQKADVVIIAGEGFPGTQRRVKALEIKYGMKAPPGLFISEIPAQMLDSENVQWIAETIKKLCPSPGLVIIDTLHRNMDGDENSSQDIGKFINNIDMFLKPLGAAVLVVHHSGHGQKDRSRGSSSIRAAMDGEFSMAKNNEGIILTCHKSKDFEALNPLQFSLQVTTLGDWQDDDGKLLTSVYLEHQGGAMANNKRSKLSARDNQLLTSLSDAVSVHGIDPPSEIKLKFSGFDSLIGKTQKIVHIDYWREKAYQAITVDSDSEEKKREALKVAFSRGRNKLFENNRIVLHGDYAWTAFD